MSTRFTVRGLAWGLSLFAVSSLVAQGFPDTSAAKNWAWDQVKSRTYYRKDARGQTIWQGVKFLDLSAQEQRDHLLSLLNESESTRRAALLVLGDRPLSQWAEQALATRHRDEVVLFLYQKGYKSSGPEPYAYLGAGKELERPWTHGLGLHLEGAQWRFQWIPSPTLLPKLEWRATLPKALERAPQPSALVRLSHLKPGLARLQQLAGGEGGLASTLAQGSRMGFFLRHIEPWLKQAAPALEPLAKREAWVLHYGVARESGPGQGTLIFIPGDLPMRTKVGLDLLRLNPLSKGARSRTVAWEDGKDRKAEITQVRGSGGVLHLWVASEGTWLCDKEAPLRALVFPTAQVTLAERQEWGRVALAGVQAQTEVSLWIVPRIGANATFERLALRRRALGLAQQTWANPSIAKAAPRLGSLSVALGAGPTEAMLATLLEDDEPVGVSIPTMPEFASDGRTLTPSQRRDYQAAVQSAKERQAAVKGLHGELLAIRRLLDLRGAALHWNGWTPAPPLSAAQKAAMAELQKLKKEDRYRANRQEMAGKVAAYGGFGEPGMTPSVALALPIQSGKSAQVEALLKAAWPKLFKGSVQQREYAKGLVVHRTRTEQAFAPAYAVQGETLVVGSDDGAVQNVLAGLLGQTPTLADTPSTAYGRIALDGAKAAKDLETLLVAYLRTNFGARYWWMSEPDSSQDEVASEMAATFAPFLGVLKGLGVQNLSVELGPGGFEVRPR